MAKNQIIFLNGVTSSGKSTLAKALQEKLTEPYFLFNMDAFVYDFLPTMLHEKFMVPDSLDTNTMILQAFSAFHRTSRALSDAGFNLIVDHVFERQEWLDECVELLHDQLVLFVHVTCPIEELRRRERERGDREIGRAENQLLLLCPRDTYDITVDTYNSSIEECVKSIIELLDNPEKLTAFKTLQSLCIK